MENNCSNCNQIITKNFCGNCGQKRYKRIDREYIWEEMECNILYMNKGFFYSIKNILRNPGKTAREFIDGSRIKHYKPIFLTFVLSGIAAFFSYRILGLGEMMNYYYSSKNLNSPFMNDMMSVLSSYMSLFMLLLLPVFAQFTRLAFRKWGQNYYEHVVMNAYVLSYYTLLSIILIYPVIFVFKYDYQIAIAISGLSIFLIPFILIWFYKGFYPDKSLKSIIWKVLITTGMIILGYIGVILIGIITGVVFAIVYGPESLEYLKPQ